MEILQTVQHNYVNDCDNKMNIFLTNIAYILIIVQPLLWNYVYLYRSRDKSLSNTDEKILFYSVILSILMILFHVIRRFPFYGEYTNELEMLKGPRTCTYKENEKHLYWNYKLYDFNRYLDVNWYTYLILFFVPGLLTDNKRSASLNLFGCILTNLYVYINNHNYHEIASIWCITSIPAMLISILPIIKEIYLK